MRNNYLENDKIIICSEQQSTSLVSLLYGRQATSVSMAQVVAKKKEESDGETQRRQAKNGGRWYIVKDIYGIRW